MLGAVAWPGGAPPEPPCAAPREAGARGALVTVRCDGRGELAGAARRLFGLPLDLNRADAAALASLPGIGPARAEAIVRERTERPFCAVMDLARVPGLGPVTIARIAPFVATSAAAPGCTGS